MIKQQFFRYVTAGGVALLVDVSIFAGLRIGAGQDLIVSNLLGRVAGAGTAFLINRTWTFRRPTERPAWVQEALRYSLLWLLASTISTFGVSVLSVALSAKPGVTENLVKICIDVMLLSMNFMLSRHWVFRTASEAPGDKRWWSKHYG